MTTALDTFIEAIKLKSKYITSNLKPKKEEVLAFKR